MKIFQEIEDNLKGIASFEDVRCVVLLRKDGTILRSVLPEKPDEEVLKLLHWMIQAVPSVTGKFAIGAKEVIFELETGFIIFVSGGATVLACVATEYANISFIRLELKRVAKIIEKLR